MSKKRYMPAYTIPVVVPLVILVVGVVLYLTDPAKKVAVNEPVTQLTMGCVINSVDTKVTLDVPSKVNYSTLTAEEKGSFQTAICLGIQRAEELKNE